MAKRQDINKSSEETTPYALLHGDCLALLPSRPQTFQLAYVDPPFFTKTTQQSTTRDGTATYSYEDRWTSLETYLAWIEERLIAIRDSLTDDGAIVYHCDRRTSHHARLLLDRVFGEAQFRAEIIWSYKRWSNTKKGLLPGHQNLYWFSKGKEYTFHPHYQAYSPTTNVDQLLQRRTRDNRDKSVYARDEDGHSYPQGKKPGVPLSDVWDIPYLNPKAKERVGYPTQKPVALLQRIISLWSHPGDQILDPFCGSGTTLIAAQSLERQATGLDVSQDALELTQQRLDAPVITQSRVTSRGRQSFPQNDIDWQMLLGDLAVTPVHRHKSIDALLSDGWNDLPVLIRIQRPGEDLHLLHQQFATAVSKKQAGLGILLQTQLNAEPITANQSIAIIPIPGIAIEALLASME